MRIDENTLTVKSALPAQTINSATTTLGTVIDTKNAEDKNFSVIFDAFTSGDFSVQILEDDVIGMGAATVVPASVVGGDKYNEVLAPDPAAGDVFSYHVNRTMSKRFLRLAIVSADTPVADVSGVANLGSLRRSDLSVKNPT